MKNYLLIAATALVLASCGESATAKKEQTAAEKLALLDNITDTAGLKSIRIKTLVNELAGKYGEPADSIADYTQRAQSVLHDHGIEETNLGVLEAMQLINKLDNTSYSDAVTAYMLLRTGQ